MTLTVLSEVMPMVLASKGERPDERRLISQSQLYDVHQRGAVTALVTFLEAMQEYRVTLASPDEQAGLVIACEMCQRVTLGIRQAAADNASGTQKGKVKP